MFVQFSSRILREIQLVKFDRHWIGSPQSAALVSKRGTIVTSFRILPNKIWAGALELWRRTLRLPDSTMLIAYQKGGGAAPYFAGLYGTGQPVIGLHQVMACNGEPLFEFESRRSGDSVSGRVLVGTWRI